VSTKLHAPPGGKSNFNIFGSDGGASLAMKATPDHVAYKEAAREPQRAAPAAAAPAPVAVSRPAAPVAAAAAAAAPVAAAAAAAAPRATTHAPTAGTRLRTEVSGHAALFPARASALTVRVR